MGKVDLHVGSLNVRKDAKRKSINDSKECSITFESILETLAYDKDPEVRMAVALNPNTLGLILDKLADDSEKDVRREVAKNPNTLGSSKYI